MENRIWETKTFIEEARKKRKQKRLDTFHRQERDLKWNLNSTCTKTKEA